MTNAIAKFQEMKPYAAQLEAKGYAVTIGQDGTIEVQDPISWNGGETISYFPCRLYSVSQVRKFINERS